VYGFADTIEAYPSELRQVFTNVLRNAVEATSEGGTIRISTEPFHQTGSDGVLIKIVDDGVGIPDNFRSKLFSAFVTSKGEHGTGLGLWVGRSIVQRHGGAITLTSNEDGRQGATASIFLPLKMGSPGEADEGALRSGASG
jgi:signal transduction histidine kinase